MKMKKRVMKGLTGDELGAAREAATSRSGFPKKLTKFEQIVKWLPSLTASQKAKLREMLQ
jgi:hypothetical protein